MIINTEMIRVRKLDSREYLAIYGTQDNPYSRDYNLMDKTECKKMAVMVADLAGRLNEMVATMTEAAESLKSPNESNSATGEAEPARPAGEANQPSLFAGVHGSEIQALDPNAGGQTS
jgi:hypothetical protein